METNRTMNLAEITKTENPGNQIGKPKKKTMWGC
jgi:hypothetical protein